MNRIKPDKILVASIPFLVPVLEIDGKTVYLTSGGFVVEWVDKNGNKFALKIMSGFLLDGASIPRVAWSPLGYHPVHKHVITDSVHHDAFFNTQGKVFVGDGPVLMEKKTNLKMFVTVETPDGRKLDRPSKSRGDEPLEFSQKYVDKLFKVGLLKHGAKKWKAIVMHRLIRMFGGKVWDREPKDYVKAFLEEYGKTPDEFLDYHSRNDNLVNMALSGSDVLKRKKLKTEVA